MTYRNLDIFMVNICDISLYKKIVQDDRVHNRELKSVIILTRKRDVMVFAFLLTTK
jgi:hypothetical protein